ncbi:MAG: SLBB domain-containing protein [bacterium]|nr:SLBB domain-containing protein [bacterium]
MGRRWTIAARVVLGLALATGCGAGRPAPVPTAPPATADAGHLDAETRGRLAALAAGRTATGAAGGYRIGPDDLLDVRIPDLLAGSPRSEGGRPGQALAEAPVMQQGFRVGADGLVQLPLLGPVPAAGRAPAELEAELRHLLRARGLLRDPQPSVLVAEYRSRVVSVVGAVERPGQYPLTRPDATLADVVWAAGGPAKDAGRVLELTPVGPDGAPAETPIRIDLDLVHAAAPEGVGLANPRMRPGDVVRLPAAGNVHVDGWVDKPGSYPVTRGLTLRGALAAAGGRMYPADSSAVRVQRTTAPGRQETLVVDMNAVAAGTAPDVPLHDGDVVQVEPSVVRLVPYGVWEATKTLLHVGGSIPLF